MMLDGWARSLPGPLYTLMRGGYLAVTTFFVLSGFVLALNYGATEWNRISLRRYVAARFARIYPVYLLSVVLVAPFIAADRAPAKAALLADYGLLLQGWTGHLPVGWNTPAWSLSCEVFFYACFPLVLILLRVSSWQTVTAIATLSCVMTRVLLATGVPDGIKPLIHLSDFLMGIAAAGAFQLLTNRKWRGRGWWLYGPAGLLALGVIGSPWLLPRAIDMNTALRPLNALLVIGLGIGGGAAARALSTPVTVYLGKASYAMYILHIPLLWWYRWTRANNAAIYLVLVLIVSTAVYRWIEEPSHRYLRGLGGRSFRPALDGPGGLSH
jgi:peptidoglycan/LPS O-acetylase OafA/YrhL